MAADWPQGWVARRTHAAFSETPAEETHQRNVGNIRSRYLHLLMAFLAAMTLSLPARAKVCGGISSSPSSPANTLSGALPGPAGTPLCHLRCRGFVASDPDAPPQQHTGAPAALETFAAHRLLLVPQAATRRVVISSPGGSPPRSTVLRL